LLEAKKKNKNKNQLEEKLFFVVVMCHSFGA
jgi:hypothetical protein